MGNRGKGTKGKSAKKGKGGKGGKKGGGASKWGDESAARDDGEHAKKKRRFNTQENQDRQRRMKIMELSRAKERDHTQRLSQPNREPTEAAPAAKRKRRNRKRPRDKRQVSSDGRSTAYYSSSDEEHEASKGADGEDVVGGMASYKKLLSELESRRSSSSRSLSSGRGDADSDLAAAMAARRMQKDGRDDYGSDSESDEEEEELEEEEGEEEEHDGESSESEDDDEVDLDATSNGAKDARDKTDAEVEFHAAAAESETIGTGAEDEEDSDGAHAAGGRSKDEFCRHFVSTSVFPPEKAVALLSASGRPSFSALSGAARGQWGAVGLAASASRNIEVPTALPAAASSHLSRDLGVLPSLADGWDACNGGPASKLQSLLLPPLTGYRDMLYCGWLDDEAEDIRRSYALHALNHALTSQRRVVRHTVRLRKAANEARVAEALARGKDGNGVAEVANGHGGNGARQKRGTKGATTPTASTEANGAAKIGKTIDTASEEWQRDQGFTRPKVLILLPFRGLAHELVEIMIGLLGPKTVVINKDRFDKEYGPDVTDDVEGAEVDGTVDGDARAERARAVVDRKPQDWKALLGEGRNVDDMFTLGLSLSPGGGKGKPGEGKGVGVRLYCDFYNSDIIIASPVAMHRASVPAEGGGGDGEGEAGVDSDFLSSVEVCILDRADVFLMQNWAYVPEIAEVLNSRPSGERASRADFSRVRPLFLHYQGRLFRQTLVFSAYQDPNLNALVSKHFRNHDGVVKVCRPNGDGHICEVALQVKQVFQRVPCDSPASQDDARFEYFVGTVLPQLLRTKQAHTAVFIPSYFDYVRLRNHLIKNKVSTANVHEYSRGSEVARSRARFFRGDRDLLLYTGRAHFFNRYCIRGIHHLIFYSLPECPQFYPEMVNLLEEAESMAAVTCLSLFTRFERLSLERIVGEERTKHMIASSKNTFLFC